MKQSLLIAAAAAAFLTAASASGASPARRATGVLYNQNSNFGYTVDSQNFESSYAQYDSVAADDFFVPAGKTWHITEVDVTGAYVDGSGPASSVVVILWKGNGTPRRIAGRGTYSWTINCTDNAGSFACTLPNNSRGKPPQLKGGAYGTDYWLTVVANCSFSGGCGYWEWTTDTTIHGSSGIWKNPSNGWGTGCEGWGSFSSCFGEPDADLAFDLVGY